MNNALLDRLLQELQDHVDAGNYLYFWKQQPEYSWYYFYERKPVSITIEPDGDRRQLVVRFEDPEHVVTFNEGVDQGGLKLYLTEERLMQAFSCQRRMDAKQAIDDLGRYGRHDIWRNGRSPERNGGGRQ